MKNFTKLLSIIVLTTTFYSVAMQEAAKNDVPLTNSQLAENGETLPQDLPHLDQKQTSPHPPLIDRSKKPLHKTNDQWNYVTAASWVTGGLLVGVGAFYDFYNNGFSNSNTVRFVKNLWTVQDPRKALFGIGAAAAVGFGWLFKQNRDLKKIAIDPDEFIKKDQIDFFTDDSIKKHELRSKVEGYIREFRIYRENVKTDYYLVQEEDLDLSEMPEEEELG